MVPITLLHSFRTKVQLNEAMNGINNYPIMVNFEMHPGPVQITKEETRVTSDKLFSLSLLFLIPPPCLDFAVANTLPHSQHTVTLPSTVRIVCCDLLAWNRDLCSLRMFECEFPLFGPTIDDAGINPLVPNNTTLRSRTRSPVLPPDSLSRWRGPALPYRAYICALNLQHPSHRRLE
jgi:hypothetical protein